MNEYGLSLSHCIDPFPVEPHRLLLILPPRTRRNSRSARSIVSEERKLVLGNVIGVAVNRYERACRSLGWRTWLWFLTAQGFCAVWSLCLS